MPFAWTIFIQVLFCVPGPTFPDSVGLNIPHIDKIAHIIIFFVFVFSWCLYFKYQDLSFSRLKLVFFFVFLAACFNGIIIEYIQKYLVPNRSFDTGDIIADILSAGIGYGICNISFLNGSRNISPRRASVQALVPEDLRDISNK